MKNPFLELVAVAIGNADRLSHTPSEEEWKTLYKMAVKQSLVGICFVGLQRLSINHPSQIICLSEILRLQWTGISARIQQRNKLLAKKANEFIRQLKDMNFDACVLKGHTLAHYYGNLGLLRQSGDVDVWIRNRNVMELDSYVKGNGFSPYTTFAHVSYKDADGIEFELHAEPAFFRSFTQERRWKIWLESLHNKEVPSTFFNLVYLMVHMYHHVLFEGLGLRQVMDYFFVLKHEEEIHNNSNCSNIKPILKSLGMLKFAEGMIWVIKYVFSYDKIYINIEPNEKVGKLLLDEILKGGNFGQHDETKKQLHYDIAIVRSLNRLKRNMKFLALGPMEILSSPVWSMWHWCWRKRKGLI